MLRLDAYVRVSRVGGREGASFISPSVQEEQIRRWAELRGVELVAWHTDLDQSGASRDRPGLEALLQRIEAGTSGGVVVARLDRFARSLTSALEAIRRIDDAGGVFTSVAEGIDPTTPAGKMQLRLMLVLAEFELDRIRDSWRVARERAVARGVHIASRPPTGYRRRDDGRLEPSEHAPAISELFRMRAGGDSWRTLCRFLDARGVVGPYGASRWTSRAAQGIVANRAYLGEARSGTHVNRAAHEPITDRSTWEAAQRARGISTPRSDLPALLAGLIRCAGCRYLLKPDSMRLRSGKRVRTYRCRGEHAAGHCRNRVAVLGRVVEPWVEARFFEQVGELVAREVSPNLAEAERAVEAAEAELAAFRDEEVISVLGRERYLEGLRVRSVEVDSTREALAALGMLAPAIPEGVSLTTLWPELSVPEKQKLLSAAVDCIFLRSGRDLSIGERALILWRGDAPDDLPRRGRRVALRPFVWPSHPPAPPGSLA